MRRALLKGRGTTNLRRDFHWCFVKFEIVSGVVVAQLIVRADAQ